MFFSFFLCIFTLWTLFLFPILYVAINAHIKTYGTNTNNMDIKEIIKLQVVSQMGMGANNSQTMSSKHVLCQMFLFMVMGLMDDVIKFIQGFLVKLRERIGKKLAEKVQEKIEVSKKSLADTSISLSTRHEHNVFVMHRIYRVDTEKSNGAHDESMEESNGMVDAIIAHASKLDNIPSLNLIDKGMSMMTYDEKPIQITQDIYLKIDEVKMSSCAKVNSIKVLLLSNTLSAAEITCYVRKVYENYLQDMKNSLGDKIYYFDQKSKDTQPPSLPSNPDAAALTQHKRMRIASAPKQLTFTMAPFYSNKKFSNIYGEEVRLIEKRVRFFLENRAWYDAKGIPYQLGILLSGKPGTGKTSTIRAIANLTKRHIINVNFANITTASQLKNLFYSDKLVTFSDSAMTSQTSYHIPIEQRMYVLEEIDAIGDIVKQRAGEPKSYTQEGTNDTINDELTLAEILTVLDGTMEIPGRIIIMTSNHPEVLDAALTRPGRIDLNISFDFSPRELIAEMYEAYFDKEFPEQDIALLPDRALSPAEIGEVLFRYFDDRDNIKGIIKDCHHAASAKNRNNVDGNHVVSPDIQTDSDIPELESNGESTQKTQETQEIQHETPNNGTVEGLDSWESCNKAKAKVKELLDKQTAIEENMSGFGAIHITYHERVMEETEKLRSESIPLAYNVFDRLPVSNKDSFMPGYEASNSWSLQHERLEHVPTLHPM